MERCEAVRETVAAATILGPVLGAALDDRTESVRCRGDQDHEGEHWGFVCPFPGFADKRVTWNG